ncbi:geminin isoform X2 [Teleopsis dalmanni]|uniref:geminin isoform X2 n=1 Tax=Teleopsis dalmanni TaxID=139649 RepID=UPI0018CD7100|nr:geminin isoform X2 [Teleopsis dalmanni]
MQEHLKNQRKTLKVLQGVATDKENLAGRPQLDKLSRLKAATDAALATTEYAKRKKTDTRAVETQTSPDKKVDANEITVEDLTSDAKPSESYWERLAEKRREALEETLAENQHLHERIAGLEEELNTSRQMLEETRNLVDVLTEMLNENEADDKNESDGVELLAIEEDKNSEEITFNKDSITDSKN